MVSTVLRNIQSEMFVISNLSYRSVIHDRKMLKTIYLTYIRPLLEYADVIWDNSLTYLVDKIEKVQMEAARIVTGDTRLVSLNNLCLETGVMTMYTIKRIWN
jgi:hypothetical protein